MAWEIAGLIGAHAEADMTAPVGYGSSCMTGKRSRVFVLVSRTALQSDVVDCDDTAEAIRTEGRSEAERVAELENPPRIVKCMTTIVEDVYR